MNLANDLLLLLLSLTQLRDRAEVTRLFLESLGGLYGTPAFELSGTRPAAGAEAFPVSTRNTSYGHVLWRLPDPPSEEDRSHLHNAAQMLAVILERLTFEERLEKERSGASLLADQRLAELTAAMGELRLSRNASLNLVEDLTRENAARQRAEESLSVSLAKYRALLDSLPVGITVADDAGNIQETNAESERLLGIPREEHARRALDGAQWRIVRPDGSPMPPDEYASVRALKEGRLVEGVEMGIVKADGSTTWISVNAVPLRIEGLGVLIAYSDISTRVRAEEEIKRQLEEKETLLREVHHRIKNNIASIEGLLSLQADASESVEVKTALRESMARIQSSRVLYEKLLMGQQFSELSTGGYVESLVDALVSVFPRRHVAIELSVADFVLPANRMVLLGIIINELLTNVFKYAFQEEEGGNVSLSLEKTGNRGTLTIKDDGVGCGAPAQAGTSTGLGLAIVNMLAQQLKGAFFMENDRGTRSVVRFEA